MDPESFGRIGAIVGGVIGVVGGLFGTYLFVKNTVSRRERAFAIKASVILWIVLIAFLAAMLLIPTWHKQLLWIPFAIFLAIWIPMVNKTQTRIRGEEEADDASPEEAPNGGSPKG